jgi:hypothetical protein
VVAAVLRANDEPEDLLTIQTHVATATRKASVGAEELPEEAAAESGEQRIREGLAEHLHGTRQVPWGEERNLVSGA